MLLLFRIRLREGEVVGPDVLACPGACAVACPEFPIGFADRVIPQPAILGRSGVQIGFLHFLVKFLGDLADAVVVFRRERAIIRRIDPYGWMENGDIAGGFIIFFAFTAQRLAKLGSPSDFGRRRQVPVRWSVRIRVGDGGWWAGRFLGDGGRALPSV